MTVRSLSYLYVYSVHVRRLTDDWWHNCVVSSGGAVVIIVAALIFRFRNCENKRASELTYLRSWCVFRLTSIRAKRRRRATPLCVLCVNSLTHHCHPWRRRRRCWSAPPLSALKKLEDLVNETPLVEVLHRRVVSWFAYSAWVGCPGSARGALQWISNNKTLASHIRQLLRRRRVDTALV